MSLKYIVSKIFKLSKINNKFLQVNTKEYIRPNDIKKIRSDTRQIYKDLKWKSKLSIDQVIKKLLSNELY